MLRKSAWRLNASKSGGASTVMGAGMAVEKDRMPDEDG